MATYTYLLDSGAVVVGLLFLVLCLCGLTYFITRRSVMLEFEKLRGALEELSKARAADSPTANFTPVPDFPASKAPTAAEQLGHETLVVIAAAVAAFLGKSVRLRSARLIEPPGGSPWAQQGRVNVQASHNLGLAHHG